jgi:CelD/BcsL family acetyltransferase involved in cellulose biosynthesis
MSVAIEEKSLAQDLAVRVQTGGAEILDGLADDWRRLCDESGEDEIFYRPEWIQAYLLAFAPKARIILISAWSGDRLSAVLPLLRQRSWVGGLPATLLTVPANVHCFRIGLPVCSGEEGETALRAVWQAVKELPGWNVIDISNVLEGNGIDRLADLARAEGFPVARKRTSQTLYLPIVTPASEKPEPAAKANALPAWLAGTRPKFRSHLRRAHRQLEEQGTLVLKHYSTADPAALERFYELEASGWKGAEGTAIQCNPRLRKFYDAVAQAAARDGYLSLDFLELGGKPIAGHFAFNLRGRYFLAKAGYDETCRRHGPGQFLVNEILSETPQRGLHEFDFVGPATWDESRWASARRTSYRVFIFRKNLYGSLLRRVRISARYAVRALLQRHDDETRPLELKSKPQGNGKEPGAES